MLYSVLYSYDSYHGDFCSLFSRIFIIRAQHCGCWAWLMDHFVEGYPFSKQIQWPQFFHRS